MTDTTMNTAPGALTDGERKAIDQIQKLLNVAAKAGTPEEAATFNAKAQELLARYNLDASVVERESGAKSGAREDARVRGGFYEYQRDLWGAVAELNFCMYWTQRYRAHHRGRERVMKRHRLVGRIVNTTATRHMAEYLEQAVERITRERLHGDTKQLFSRWAISFREGAVRTIIDKIRVRRREQIDQEELRAEQAATAGYSTSTALTLASLAQREEDANNDFLYGEGYTAKQAAEAAQWAEAQKQREVEYTMWAAAHPEEVRAREEKRRKEQEEYDKREARNARRRKGRSWNPNSSGKKIDGGAFRAGREAGKGIGLDPQSAARKPAGLLK